MSAPTPAPSKLNAFATAALANVKAFAKKHVGTILAFAAGLAVAIFFHL